MNPQKFARQVLVTATMALAAFASWAVTDYREPAIDIAIVSTQQPR